MVGKEGVVGKMEGEGEVKGEGVKGEGVGVGGKGVLRVMMGAKCLKRGILVFGEGLKNVRGCENNVGAEGGCGKFCGGNK